MPIRRDHDDQPARRANLARTLEDLDTDELDQLLDDDLVTVRDVELVRTGQWGASTGPVDITTEDLDAMVEAEQDTEVDAGAIRRGHYDTRYDGEPALGWVQNLSRRGERLYGDLVDVPARVARLLRSAYRRRSVELAFGVRTPSGRRHRAVLSGLALLGVQAPAVPGLAEVALSRWTLESQLDSGREGSIPEPVAERVAMLANGEDLGSTPASATAAARLHDAIDALADGGHAPVSTIEALRSATDGLTDTTQPPDPTTGRDTMPIDEDRLRELLELEEGADIEAAITELQQAATAGDGAGDGSGDGEEESEEEQEQEQEERQLAGAALSAGTLAELQAAGLAVVTTGTLEELTTGVQEGRDARQRQRAEERERALSAALSSGRITPAERPTWEAQLEENHDGTIALLGALAPTAVPTTERGADDGADAQTQVSDEAWAEFEAETFGFDAETQEA